MLSNVKQKKTQTHFQTDTCGENMVCRGLIVKPADNQCSLKINVGERQPFLHWFRALGTLLV